MRLLTVFAFMLLVLPASATIGAIGAIAFPAALAAISLAMLYVAAVLMGLHDPRRLRYPTRWTFALLWATSLASYVAAQRNELNATEANGADRWMLLVLAISGVAFVASEGIRTVEGLLKVVRAIVWGGALCGGVALLQFWFSIDLAAVIGRSLIGFSYDDTLGGILQRGALNRVPGTTLHPIELGAVTALVLPLAVAMSVIDRDRSWRMRLVPLVLVAAGVPTSVSRSAVVALVVALAVFLFQVGPVLRVTIVSALLPALVAVFVVFPGLLSTLASFITGAGTDTSITTRTDDYAMVEDLARQRPWLGSGGGTYLPDDLLRILDNTYLTAVVELGLVGLVVLVVAWFVLPLVTALATRRRARDPRVALLAGAMSAGLAATAVSAATFDSLSFPTLALLQAMVIGLVGAAWRLRDAGGPDGVPVPEEDRMETLALLRAVRRNRGVVAAVAAFTVLGALLVALLLPTTYAASSTLLVQPPPAAPSDAQIDADPRLQGLDADNPFTRRFDPTTMIAMMSMPVTSKPGTEAVAADGGTASYSVDQVLQYDSGTAFAKVTAWGGSPQEAVRTAELVDEALQDRLEAVQSDPGPSDLYLITAPVVQPPTLATVEQRGSARLILLVIGLGVVVLVVAVSVADALRELRAGRTSDAARADPGVTSPS